MARPPLCVLALLVLTALAPAPLPAAEPHEAVRDAFGAVTRIHADVPGDARTAEPLGTERDGSGVVIDDSGLVLTIGYLILEASAVTVTDIDGHDRPADIVAYDHATGLGLVRALSPLGRPALPFGDSAALKKGDPVLAVAGSGAEPAVPGVIADIRTFAGYWEYLLEGALYVHPPHPAWQGAALIGSDGRLIGIGSLFAPDAQRRPRRRAGTMFVPIDALKPILGDLLTVGRGADSVRPWLGVFSSDHGGHVVVTYVPPDTPAAEAGLRRGDVILEVAGEPVRSLPEFYRAVWALGKPGVRVPLTLGRQDHVARIEVTSADRYLYMKAGRTY